MQNGISGHTRKHVHLSSLDDDFLSSRELLCAESDPVALDSDPPFTVRERGAFCRASDGYGYLAPMPFDVLDLSPVASLGKHVQESSMSLGVHKVPHEVQRLGERLVYSSKFSRSRSADLNNGTA